MQDTDLPIILEELPNFRLQNIQNKKFDKSQINEDFQYQTAFDFIKKLQDYLTGKVSDKDGLYSLYDFEFNQLSNTVFENSQWPAPEKIEEKFSNEDQDVEFEYNTICFYNELCYRHIFARLTNTEVFNSQMLAESWENYLEVFEIINNNKSEIPLPSSWIWDIIDEFIYQFQVSSKFRQNSQNEKESNLKSLIETANKKKNNPNADPVFWNLETVLSLLNGVIENSKVIQTVNNVKQLSNGINETSTFFGHFALVGLMRLYVLQGQYQKAVETVEQINYDSLFIFSKAVPSYLTLFYYAGTAYLMSQKYNEAVNLFQAIVLFFFKYKQFLSKSFQFDNMTKQAEKCLILLTLAQVFYPSNMEDTIKSKLEETIIKSGQKNDQKQETLAAKLLKLQSFSPNALNEVYNSGFPKPFTAIKNMEEFISLGFGPSKDRQNQQPKEHLEKEFQNIKYLNDIASILKIYSNVQTSKVAKLLNIKEDQLQTYLNAYKQRNQSSIRKDVPFEQTVLQRFLLNGQVQLDFKVENSCIYVTEVAPQRNYVEYFSSLNTKLVQQEAEIAKIGHI